MRIEMRLLTGILIVVGFMSPVYADDSYHLGLGVSLQSSSWQGENLSSGEQYDTQGGLSELSLSLMKGRFYTGMSLQGSRFDFKSGAPDQVSATGVTTQSVAELERGEFDLVAGYFFWDRVSLFLDFKSASYKWKQTGLEQQLHGLGLGVSGNWPVSANWNLFSSLGVVSLKAEASGDSIGDGASSLFRFGGSYAMTAADHFQVGLKIQSHRLSFDAGTEQKYGVSGVFVGYRHVFDLK